MPQIVYFVDNIFCCIAYNFGSVLVELLIRQSLPEAELPSHRFALRPNLSKIMR